jgi:hypothetical protein
MDVLRASNQEIIDTQLPDEEEQIDEDEDEPHVMDFSRARQRRTSRHVVHSGMS